LTIFGEKLAFFSKTNIMITYVKKLALFSVKNANFFAEFFGENISKIITSVPGRDKEPGREEESRRESVERPKPAGRGFVAAVPRQDRLRQLRQHLEPHGRVVPDAVTMDRKPGFSNKTLFPNFQSST
jgi:hypothetical protein